MDNFFSHDRASGFDRLRWFNDPIFNDWIVDKVACLGRTICDVGAGSGIMAEYYHKSFDTVYAIEPNESMFNVLSQKARLLENCVCLQNQAENIDLANKSVDIAISKSSLHHFSNIGKGIKEMTRIATNAVCIVEVIAPDDICIPFAQKLLIKKEPTRKHSAVFTEMQLHNFIKKSSDEIRSLIFDQYIYIDSWLKNSDLPDSEKQDIKSFILSQGGVIKEKMQIHRSGNDIIMLRRMNLQIAILKNKS